MEVKLYRAKACEFEWRFPNYLVNSQFLEKNEDGDVIKPSHIISLRIIENGNKYDTGCMAIDPKFLKPAFEYLKSLICEEFNIVD